MTISELALSSKIYVGSTLAKKVYIGSNKVWSASRLPDGYTELPYISSTASGGQYIDLGCKLLENTDNITIDIKFKIIGNGKNSTGLSVLLACKREVSPYPGFVLRTINLSTLNDTRLEFGVKWLFTNSYTNNNGTYYVVNYEGATTSKPFTETSNFVGDIVEDTIVLDSIPLSLIINLNTTLFAGYSSDGVTPFRYIEADLYYLKLTKGTAVVRELIPALRNSDNEVGLYDILNNVFYPSAGANSFVAGTAS